MPSHLRLVVDNSQPDHTNDKANDLTEESAELVLYLLDQLGEVNVVETWQTCINFPISGKENHYNHFMARNWQHFSYLLQANPQNIDLQHKHRLVNYFMMRVYLIVMGCRVEPGQELALLKAPYKPTQLDFWAIRFAMKIINNEASCPKNDFDPLSSDFGGRVRKIIESA